MIESSNSSKSKISSFFGVIWDSKVEILFGIFIICAIVSASGKVFQLPDILANFVPATPEMPPI